ncbi:neuroglian-like [Coccinella septempunctata]|uniref:neuroglian-like n=1 Tax=Coccinella septempunctata TaxID=41139 RepID=UPI001D05D6C7|nr:neuroglian-like [Coccinella septempunctata]
MSFICIVLSLLVYPCYGINNIRELVPKEAPQNLSIIEIHGKYLQVEWDPVPPESVRGTFRGYLVRIWNHASSQVYAVPPQVNRASIEFFPYSRNFVTVSVRNNKFIGPPSDAINFDAPQGAPNYPTLFEAHQIGNSSLLLQWNMPTQPNGILLGYKIYCTEVNSTYVNDATAFSFIVLDPLKFQTKISDLTPGATYKIGVAAINCVGESLTNYLDIQIYPHYPSQPSVPDFKYNINYVEIDTEEICIEPVDHFEKEDNEFYLTNMNNERSAKSSKRENPCYVTTRITWIPDIGKNPGSHFYVKYKMKGAPDYFVTDHEFRNDFMLLKHFDACQSYDIIVVSVDDEFETESKKVETPVMSFPPKINSI